MSPDSKPVSLVKGYSYLAVEEWLTSDKLMILK